MDETRPALTADNSALPAVPNIEVSLEVFKKCHGETLNLSGVSVNQTTTKLLNSHDISANTAYLRVMLYIIHVLGV